MSARTTFRISAIRLVPLKSVEEIGAFFGSAHDRKYSVRGSIGKKKQQAQGVAQLSPAETPGILRVGPGRDIGLDDVASRRLRRRAGEQIEHRGRHVQGDMPELPQRALFEQGASSLCQRAEVPTERDDYGHPGRAFEPDEVARIPRRGGKRLFDEYVTTAFECCFRVLIVKGMW